MLEGLSLRGQLWKQSEERMRMCLGSRFQCMFVWVHVSGPVVRQTVVTEGRRRAKLFICGRQEGSRMRGGKGRRRPAPSAPCWRRMVLQPWSLPTTLLPLPTSVSDFIHQWMQLEPGCSNHLSMVHRVGLMPLAHEPLGDTSYRDSKHVG